MFQARKSTKGPFEPHGARLIIKLMTNCFFIAYAWGHYYYIWKKFGLLWNRRSADSGHYGLWVGMCCWLVLEFSVRTFLLLLLFTPLSASPDPGEMSQSLRGPFVHSCWGSFWHKARGSGRLPGPRNYAVPCCLSAITNGIYRSIHSICGNPELSWRFGGRRVMAVLSASWHIMLAHHGRWIRHKSEMAVPHNFRGFQSW